MRPRQPAALGEIDVPGGEAAQRVNITPMFERRERLRARMLRKRKAVVATTNRGKRIALGADSRHTIGGRSLRSQPGTAGWTRTTDLLIHSQAL